MSRAPGGGSTAGDPELFGDRLASRVATRASQLVIGLDPDPARLWPEAVDAAGGAGDAPAARAARAVARHCELVLDAVASECVAAKLQVACFERLGAAGWAALDAVAQQARERGLLVIADAKRGDVDVTAAAYARAYFGETPTPFGLVGSLGPDALTVNPLLGRDSLAPIIAAARAVQAGVFALVRTSNPGAADVQELRLESGETVSDRLARLVAEIGDAGIGDAGLSDVGAVVGATAPERLERLRNEMPHAAFLLPGVGAQGGKVEDLAAAFLPGRAGGLVSASRSIVGAYERTGGEPAAAARAQAARLRELTWALSA